MSLAYKTVSFQTIWFSISTLFNSILPIDRILSAATTPGPSDPGSDGNKGVLHIPQSPSFTGTSPSDCFVSYRGHSLGESYPSAEMQSTGQCHERFQSIPNFNCNAIRRF